MSAGEAPEELLAPGNLAFRRGNKINHGRPSGENADVHLPAQGGDGLRAGADFLIKTISVWAAREMFSATEGRGISHGPNWRDSSHSNRPD